ncbi:MAG: 6-carboxytetrahydropterin synthase [Verrucomicrobiaceae bacterium]|nr:6-carboxytetrahydropterin synthase [Verrucomicrobiaceae bacterium]
MGTTHDFTLRFSRRYSMGHRLISDAAPNCRVPHGHDEVVTVELVSEGNSKLDPRTNMLVEFDQAKRRWFDWIDDAVDHSFHLNEEDPLVGFFSEHEPHLMARLLLTPGDPTTEIRAACFKSKLGCFLQHDNPGLRCSSLTIQETPTNAVICEAVDPAQMMPTGDHWWSRADLSINDLPQN